MAGRCVLSYFKSDADASNPDTMKGRLVLVPTAVVRSVTRDVFLLESGDMKLQLRAPPAAAAEWMADLVRINSTFPLFKPFPFFELPLTPSTFRACS